MKVLIDDDDDDEEVYVPKKQKFLQKLKKEKEKDRQKIEKRKKTQVVNVWGQGTSICWCYYFPLLLSFSYQNLWVASSCSLFFRGNGCTRRISGISNKKR